MPDLPYLASELAYIPSKKTKECSKSSNQKLTLTLSSPPLLRSAKWPNIHRPGLSQACAKPQICTSAALPPMFPLPRPATEPIAVPVPAAGVDAELVDAPVLDLLKEGDRAQLLHDV